jgi:signal transduction histidine kinase/ActR/RegA family two-component response regulator
MTVDPNVIRSKAHTEIGARLIQDVGIVLDRWSRRAIEEQPNATRVHHSVLLNDLRDFLHRLGQSLAESEDPYTRAHHRPAVFHGEQRWESGWLLTEVIRDFQILRLVLLDYLEEVLDRPLGYQESLAVGLALDEAITVSVVAYVSEREEHQRRLAEQRAVEDQQIQERLRHQAEALQEANQRKNEFIATLAHELRNPLASIGTALQIQRKKGFPDPELQWSLEVMERQIGQITRLVDDLLDVTRITQGKIKLQREPIDVATVLSRALEMAKPFVESRKHELIVTVPSERCWLEGDPARLVQIVTNLLHNAAKYTKDGGQIWLTVDRENDEVVIKVRDTGIGISADLLPHIFDPFVQAERSLSRSDGGLGLGLTLVRSLVELHGGTVQVQSGGLGHGSEFAVRLPVLTVMPQPVAKPVEPTTKGSGPIRRILVVDDNQDGAKALAMLLRLQGHDVEIAHDGPDALRAAFNSVPDVVLLDIGLPGMDGLEVARRLRVEPRLRNCLIAAISGYGQDDDRRRSEEAGFDAHLVKPFDLTALERLLSTSRRESSK